MLDAASDKPVVGEGSKGDGLDLPIFLVQVGSGGDDLIVDQADHEDAALGLLPPESVDQQALVVVGHREVNNPDDFLKVDLPQQHFGGD